MFDRKTKMIVSESNRDEIVSLIINELKDIGVKYRKDKKSKVVQSNACRKRIFQTHLHLLELTDVILANGGVVQIPKFVADACNRILEHVETEGIFRKAGSSIRQKEIRTSLESGMPLGKAHHVIDVANVVKSFFRELPEPLIPPSMQETLLRSLLIGEHYIKAILLTCLLLPPIAINTLSFFMQFLQTVSLSSHLNKMSSENLAIIFTPGLMPFSDISSHRFNNHVKMVQLLIENANLIGTVPESIIEKMKSDEAIPNSPYKSRSFEAVETTQKKKKKRRSGSLTQMFNGIRKMVGSTKGSSENLDNTPENKSAAYNAIVLDKRQPATPSSKSAKKRKFTEPVCAFSAKKKRDLLALLPNNSGGFLPNTPQTKDVKKSRLSLGGRRQIKNISNNIVVTSMERRWSIVGSGWSKSKTKCLNGMKKECSLEENNKPSSTKHLSPIISMQCISKLDAPNSEFPVGNISFADAVSHNFCTDMLDEDYVRISKHEYEAIKERVAAIETQISQEFGSLQNSSTVSSLYDDLSGPERVVNKYEQITEKTISHLTDDLAHRLSHGLKIRRSSEHRVIRSPSARKIGTIRRRSQEKVRLSRNQTWHISSSVDKAVPIEAPQNCFYSKSNLKRGRPNTLNTGLLQQHCTPSNDDINTEYDVGSENNCFNEKWTDGETFFCDPTSTAVIKKPHNLLSNFEEEPIPRVHKMYNYHENQSTPRKQNIISSIDKSKTPMLPPKSIPRKISSIRTPNSAMKTSSTKMSLANALQLSTSIDEEVNGRASIARLRAQNAGMVLAKAKLFDGLGEKHNVDVDVENAVHILNPVKIYEKCQYKTSNSCETNEGELKKCVTSENVKKHLPGQKLLTQRSSNLNTLDTKENHKNIHSKNFRHNKIGRSPNTPRSQKQILPNAPHRLLNKTIVSNAPRIRTPLKSNTQVTLRNTPRVPKIKLSEKRIINN